MTSQCWSPTFKSLSNVLRIIDKIPVKLDLLMKRSNG